MKQKSVMPFVYTILHFMVDFTTVFLITGLLLGPRVGMINRGYVVIIYNLIAFAGQLPMGMIADVLNKNALLVAIGCALAGLSYPVVFVFPWLACIIAAVGNGLFHIGAGCDVLEMSMPRAGFSGLFVSSGALGVWLAYKASGIAVLWLCPAVMLIVAALMLAYYKLHKAEERTYTVRYEKPEAAVLIAVSCFMLTVVIRSLLGMVMNFSWKVMPLWSLLFVMAVAGGKVLGGFIGDRLGYIKTVIISMLISLVGFAFSSGSPVAGVIGVLCFNMTMPLTLTAIAGVSNRKYGFAFGLTTFALAIGFIPVVFGANKLFGAQLLLWSAGISLLLMVSGYSLLKKVKADSYDMDFRNSRP